MRKYILTFCGILIALSSSVLQNCATIIESDCSLDLFEGIYVGNYLVAGALFIEDIDTLTITVIEERNSATLKSYLLDTTIELKYSESKNRLLIPDFSISDFVFDIYTLNDVDIESSENSFVTLDGSCNGLKLKMQPVHVRESDIPINNGVVPNTVLESASDFLRIN